MMLRSLARKALTVTPLPEMVLRYRARRHLTVLGYHRILPPVGTDYPFNDSVISATPEEFARELRFLKTHTDVISIGELCEGLKNPAHLPERPAVITFDDGYLDNYQHAFPLLKEARLPACFFICTSFPGTREVPWQEAWVCCLKKSKAAKIDSPFAGGDPPYELGAGHLSASIRRFRQQARYFPWKRVPELLARLQEVTGINPRDFVTESMFMSWNQMREMEAAGMTMGGHTRRHSILSRVDDPAALRDEIGGCFDDLHHELGKKPLAFAYPFGYADYMSEPADREIERAGFEISFSFINGFAPRAKGRTRRLPRIHASHGENYHAFRFRTAMAPRQN